MFFVSDISACRHHFLSVLPKQGFLARSVFSGFVVCALPLVSARFPVVVPRLENLIMFSRVPAKGSAFKYGSTMLFETLETYLSFCRDVSNMLNCTSVLAQSA